MKHDRDKNFEKASLENCLNAVAAVLILLYSQFGVECLNTKTTNVYYGSEGYDDAEFGGDTMFTIIPPEISNWREDELYDFKWNDLKNKRSPFNTFDFE